MASTINPRYQRGDALRQVIHTPRSTEHTDSHQYRHQVRNDAHGGSKPFFRSFDKRIVHIDFLADARQDETDDNHEQEYVGEGGRVEVDLVLRQGAEEPDDACNEQGSPSQKQENRTVQEVDALVKSHGDNAGKGGNKGGDEYRYEYIGGLCRPQLGTVDHDADRYQGQSRSVYHQKHNHRIGGGIFLRIQFLQAFHRLESEGGGGIVQSQHISRHVHENASCYGMPFGNIGEEFGEQWAEHTREEGDNSALFADAHDAHPKRQHTGQPEGNLESRLGRSKGRVDDVGEYLRITKAYQPYCSYNKSQHEKSNPNVI